MQPKTGTIYSSLVNEGMLQHMPLLGIYLEAHFVMLKETGDTWRAGPAFQSYPGQAQHSEKN